MRALVSLGVVVALIHLHTPAGGEEPGTAEPVEVEVRGTPPSPAVAPLDPSVAGSTIRRAELERPGLTAPEVLRTEVGLSITETGGLGAASTASIRGATAAETPVYLGGVRINDDVAGAADLSTLPLWLVDRVDIYRGNAPFEADRLGIGGALFFQPLRPRSTHAAVGVSAGSYGSEGAHALGSVGNSQRGLLVGASYGSAKNDYAFTADDGQTEHWQNADATLLDLWLLGRTSVGAATVDVMLNHFSREQGAVRLASVQTYEARKSLDRTLGAVTSRVPLGERATLELRTSALLATSVLDDPRREILPAVGAAGTRLEQRGERVEQEAAARSSFGQSTRARVAVQASSERLRRYERAEVSGSGPSLDAERVTARLAGSAEHDVNRWLALRALLAFECHSTTTGAAYGVCDTLEPAARFGGHVHVGELSGFVALGRYSRPPTLGELYGTSPVVVGNPDLVSESGVTLDAGVRFARALPHEKRPLYAALSGYARRSEDLVAFVLTSQGYVRPENVEAARVLGLELEAGSGFGRYFAADLALTLMDFRNRTPGWSLANDIYPYHSRLVAAPGLVAISPTLENRWLNQATLGAKLVYQSNRYGDLAGLAVIPEQASLDVDAAFLVLDRTLWVRARVTDVFDAKRYDVVGFPLPGRSAFVSLEVRAGSR